MKFGSLFSGIGGFDLGFERAGMECAWQCEIDQPCQKLLSHKFGARLYDDVRTITAGNAEPVDLICGGFPCQDVSIAGKRTGLAGERSGLWNEFARIIEEFKPRWVVVENVPGLLSSNQGRDFETVISQMVESGYGVCWRILDAQYFGVAQRRRRVFIVGSLGDGRSAEVLFEREGVRWNPPSRQSQGEENSRVSGTLAASGSGLDRPSGNGNQLYFCVPVAGTLDLKSTGANRGSQANETDFIVPAAFGGNNTSGEIDQAACLTHHPGRYDFESETFIGCTPRRTNAGFLENVTPTLNAGTGGFGAPGAIGGFGVRRLTPMECERLQGFPDGWTAGQSDSTRYKQLGNAVAVPVAEWIGRRIMGL